MKVVYKYPVKPNIEMPRDAQILDVQWQGRDSVLWALVDTDAPPAFRRMLIVGTGHPLPIEYQATAKYICTRQMDDGIVLHFFDLGCGV